jgi:hypothetical protein
MEGCGINGILSFLPAVGKFLYAVELFGEYILGKY